MDLIEAFEAGRVRFMDLELTVARGALVPRPETELLGRTAIAVLEKILADNGELRVIDMCCGIGNLTCAIAHHVPAAHVWASDLTSVCVETARANAAALGLTNVSVHEGDLFQPLAGLGLEGRVDAIVCNPPYISEK